MIETAPTRLISALIIAPSWAIAFALLVKGHAEMGDGFSAGLLAGTGVLIHYLVFGREQSRRLWVLRRSLPIAGVGLLLVLAPVVLPPVFRTAPMTHYPPAGTEPIGLGALELHSGFVLDAGVMLVVLGFLLTLIELLSRSAGPIRERRR